MDTETNLTTISSIQPDQEEPAHSDTPPLQTPAGRAWFVYISFILLGLLFLVFCIRDYHFLFLLSISDSEKVDTSLIDFFDSISTPLMVTNGLFAILSVIAFLLWAHRVAKNTLTMMPGPHYFSTPARYIWTYFIPIISVYKPWKGMIDIYKTTLNTSTGKKTTEAGIVVLWWILFFLCSFISNLSNRSDKVLSRMNEEDITDKILSNNLKIGITAEITWIISIAITIWIVFKITRGQMEIIKRESSHV